ncbi:25S rRNA adenine-N(1) methyltransferase [Hypsizygus marmoreus]|uniref:25S rRNA adenine-N(1) methyltransferase n=1 Tax=Hypsizygus marmoreus TaxID=39966 RepID=A0A369JKT3_HYPMA|nr:25S rRNA adenine-N(1) methyltransferase [Hypsizygus marmoreus]
MPKARRKKIPIASVEAANSSSNTSHSSRTIIRQFHVLLKRQAQLQSSPTLDANSKNALADVQRQIADLGGLECYQRMSAVGQGSDRGGGSEKILIGWLKEMGLQKSQSSKLRYISNYLFSLGHDRVRSWIRLLEVGALKPDNYRSCISWIDPTPMDLRSRHPSILEQDFLLLDVNEHRKKWDVISLSLVLNFVPAPKDRGRMLNIAHSLLSPSGYLFLALPLPCVANSRYLNFEYLKSLMGAIGFVQLQEKWKEGRKMAYWLYRKEPQPIRSPESFQKKRVVRQGNRNNFCVVL